MSHLNGEDCSKDRALKDGKESLNVTPHTVGQVTRF